MLGFGLQFLQIAHFNPPPLPPSLAIWILYDKNSLLRGKGARGLGVESYFDVRFYLFV